MPQHSTPIFALTATGTGQLQQGLRLPLLLGRDVTAGQGSLGNTAPAQDTDNTLGWVGIGLGVVAGGLRSATLLNLSDSSAHPAFVASVHYRAGGAPGEPVTPPAWAATITGSLLAPPREFGGVLAGAAGTLKKCERKLCLLSRSHPGGEGDGRSVASLNPL
jgi:hypothetical protein